MAIGAKSIETRSWGTPYRGPIAIHATKETPVGTSALCNRELFRQALAEWGDPGGMVYETRLPRSAILAVVDLVECVKVEAGFAAPDIEGVFGNLAPGRFAWRLANARRLVQPVPTRGGQGLRNLPPELEELVRLQLPPGAA